MFINITHNVCTLAVGNRIGSSARRQPSRSAVRHSRLRRQNSDSEESDPSDRENSDRGESFEHLYLNVCHKICMYSLESSRTIKQIAIYSTVVYTQVIGISGCVTNRSVSCYTLHFRLCGLMVGERRMSERRTQINYKRGGVLSVMQIRLLHPGL
jgi:hypothetical protein